MKTALHYILKSVQRPRTLKKKNQPGSRSSHSQCRLCISVIHWSESHWFLHSFQLRPQVSRTLGSECKNMMCIGISFTIDENWMRSERVHNGCWTRLDSHVPAHVLMQLQPPYCCYYRPARTWDHLQSIQQYALFEHTYDTLFMTSTIAHTIRFTLTRNQCTWNTINSHNHEHNQFASIPIACASNFNIT